MMMPDRVHPSVMESHSAEHSSELPDSPRSSASSAYFVRKDPIISGSYIVQVPKDQIYRVPPPENAARFKAYTRRGKSNRRSTFFRCICWTLLVLILLAVAIAAVAAVLYLIYHPKVPKYTVEALSIKRFDLASSGPLSPQIVATIRAENPNNDLGIDYRSGSDISVSYNDVKLCDGAWPTFFQGTRNVTIFTVALASSGLVLSPSIEKEIGTAQGRSQVPLNLHIKDPVRVKIGAIKTWTFKVNVQCEITVDKMAANSQILSNTCSVKVNPW